MTERICRPVFPAFLFEHASIDQIVRFFDRVGCQDAAAHRGFGPKRSYVKSYLSGRSSNTFRSFPPGGLLFLLGSNNLGRIKKEGEIGGTYLSDLCNWVPSRGSTL